MWRTRGALSLDLLFFISIVLTCHLASCDKWSTWSKWSECSRTCDGGATYQDRKCLRSNSYKSRCEGERFRYNTCNIQPCAPDAVDFRAQQCAAYNNATYGGKYYTWLPYTDRKNPCTLYCIPKGSRTVVRLAPKVLDGTRCRFNSNDMCISGKCWTVGCDHRLDSTVTFDLCGVCGGNNSCLNNGTKGRYHWVEIGLSPCSSSCGVGIQTYQYRCRDRLTGNQVPDTRCSRNPRPKGRQSSCFRRQCPPTWKIFPWQSCSKSCGGGFTTRAVRCMDTLRDGRQQWHHDRFCSAPKPSTSRPCNTQMCPRWYAGEWSPCSATCGWGQQVREVVCRHEGKTFCEFSDKPVTRRNCTTIFPCRETDGPRYIAQHDEDAHSYQELRSGSTTTSMETVVIHEKDVHKYDMTRPRYVVSEWGECSTTCGESYRFRYVRCRVHLVYLKDMVDLDDSDCTDVKPTEKELCQRKPCYDDYRWVSKGMTTCSRTCLGGTQETKLQCIHTLNKTNAPVDNCLKSTRPPIYRKMCNDFPCPQIWRIGDFGECSSTCGGGVMMRDVRCVQQVDIVRDTVLKLPDVMCEQPVPHRSRDCNRQPCPADWAAGYWSECSATCGTGTQLRPVVCQRMTGSGQPVDVNEYSCPPTEKPESQRQCNVSACPEVKIRRKKMKFFQINKIPKVNLNVGADASILPGTSVTLRCPVKGMDKTKVEWFKNKTPIRAGRRVFKSKSGKLRIKRSRPDKDTGTYTCIAAKARASVNIVFLDLYAILQETVKREKYLLGFLNDQSYSNHTATLKDPFDRRRRPLQLVVANWSSCSTSCGVGVRKRKMSCEIITDNYFEIFPVKTCQKAGVDIPSTTQKCYKPPCTRWVTNEWSECLVNKCVRESFSVQIRSVSCVTDFNSNKTDNNLCDQRSKPLSRKECSNPHCRPRWNTSEWSDCVANCGQSGFQTRMLTCLWKGSGQPAGRSCELLKRPVLTRSCFNNCTHGMWPNSSKHNIECVDKSEYCSVVPKMKLCRFTSFKKKCCHSCSTSRENLTS